MATLVTLAQYRMNNDHMDGGWAWGMAALMLIAVIAVVVLAVWLVRSTGAGHSHAQHTAAAAAGAETPMQILDRRLAQGDIAPDEYKERAAILGKP